MPASPKNAEVERQLQRILAHSLSRSQWVPDLLRAIVNRSLAGGTGSLKEVALARVVYGLENYDPQVHSRVRVDANTLRKRLEKYYATDGANDPILIEIPTGTYVASFTWRAPVQQGHSDPNRIRIAAAALIACLAALVLMLGLRWRGKPESGLEVPVQLTFDNGFTSEPSLSADGKVLVYASDRGPDGIVHIWIQSGNDPPRQLTVIGG